MQSIAPIWRENKSCYRGWQVDYLFGILCSLGKKSSLGAKICSLSIAPTHRFRNNGRIEYVATDRKGAGHENHMNDQHCLHHGLPSTRYFPSNVAPCNETEEQKKVNKERGGKKDKEDVSRWKEKRNIGRMSNQNNLYRKTKRCKAKLLFGSDRLKEPPIIDLLDVINQYTWLRPCARCVVKSN